MDYITIVFRGRSRVMARPDSYSALTDKARAGFNISDDVCSDSLVFSLTPLFYDHEVELDSSAYGLVTNMSTLRLDISDLATPAVARSCSDGLDESADPDSGTDANNSAEIPHYSTSLTERASKRRRHSIDDLSDDDDIKREVTVASPRAGGGGKSRNSPCLRGWAPDGPVSVPLWSTVGDLKAAVHELFGFPEDIQHIIFAGKQLEDHRGLHEYRIQQDDTVYMVFRFRGGKPAVYLLSPTPIEDISVSVALSHHWTFSTIYPLTEPRALSGRRCAISWKVSTKANGDLSDYGTGLDCRYLFWEADAVADANALESDVYPFNPQNPKLRRAGSSAFILSFNDFVPYLDRALKSMTLTTEMRTDFVVYWLPALQKIRDRGLDVAFDFVPQADLEKVATLDTKPGPEAVARIFLLFDGVAKGAARSIIDMDGVDWPARIGMDAKAMQNTSLFRVLEWGGMEAKVF
ncbi:Ubiquitin-60S ribosomal protein L40 [Colletotrichum sidae]|uniref:Ubiquitin-60S ribosomal protein L40 n=1 Tax=Colletotrichum sidae TaxID=1347389 RepID=A0A4R8T4H4_9PEZI|nr:Ubiquitin-60S ribosomal protein L40 [Colletotrichum sidae]